MNRKLLIFGMVLLTVGCLEAWTPKQLPSGTTSNSPNHEYLVEYRPDQLQIKNTLTNQPYKPVAVLPVSFITWTRDSRTIVIVEHIAGGSAVVLVHFNGEEWENFMVSPPGKQYDSYSVVELKPGHSTISLSYKAAIRDIKQPTQYLCTFDIDPATARFSNVTIKERL